MARPKLAAARRRSTQLNIRLPAAIRDAVDRAAAAQELRPVEWARRAVTMQLGKPLAAAGEDQAALEEAAAVRRELVRIGTLLNQLARRSHQGKPVGPRKLEALLLDVRDRVGARIELISLGTVLKQAGADEAGRQLRDLAGRIPKAWR